MSLSAKTGSFTTSTSTGDLAVTGVGFQPKAIIFKLTQNRTLDTTQVFGGTAQGIGFGFSAGNGDNACYFALTAGAKAVRQVRSDVDCIYATDADSSSARTLGRVVSMDSDGFTVNLSVAAVAAKIDYLALGGDDITNATTFRFTEPGVTGDHSVTGIGFEPLLLVCGDSWGGTTNIDQQALNSSIRAQLAFITEPASVAHVFAVSPLNGGSNSLMTSMRTDDIAVVYGHIGSTTSSPLATFVSMDADGFTLNYSAAPGGTARTGIAIGGTFDVQVGSITEPGSVSAVAEAASFTPRAALLMSQGMADTTTMTNNGAGVLEVESAWGIWALDGGHYTSAWVHEKTASTEFASALTRAGSFDVVSQTSAGVAPLKSRLTLDGSTFGSLEFDFSTVSGSGIEVGYIAFGDQPPPSGGGNGVRYRTRRAIG